MESSASSQTGSELGNTERFAAAEAGRASGQRASDYIFGDIEAKGVKFDPGSDVVNAMLIDEWPHHLPLDIAETIAHLQALIEVLPAALESSQAAIRHSPFVTDQRLNKAVEMLRSYRLATEVVHADRVSRDAAEAASRRLAQETALRNVLQSDIYREGERVIREREERKLRAATRKTSKKVKRG